MSSDFRNVDVVGQIVSISQEIEGVQTGMSFSFGGHNLRLFSSHGLPSEVFDSGLKNILLSQKMIVDSIISGQTFPGFDSICFHVCGSAAIDGVSIALPVCYYWSFTSGYSFEDVAMIRFFGSCIDSFYPRGRELIDEDGTLIIPNNSEKSLAGGCAAIDDGSISFFFSSGWEGSPRSSIKFYSFIGALAENMESSRIEYLYQAVACALRFCLGRSNADCELRLYASTEQGRYKYIGHLSHSGVAAGISDERDEPWNRFIRAGDIGDNFGILVQAFLDRKIDRSAFAISRADSNLLTNSKIIELTAYFEKRFGEYFPEGVKHSQKTVSQICHVIDEFERVKDNLNSDEKRRVDRCISYIRDDDNLQSRILHAFKSLDPAVCNACVDRLSVDPCDGDLGRNIQTLRNDIAHGNVPKIALEDVCDEYHFLLRLVRALELLNIDFNTGDTAALVKLF